MNKLDQNLRIKLKYDFLNPMASGKLDPYIETP